MQEKIKNLTITQQDVYKEMIRLENMINIYKANKNKEVSIYYQGKLDMLKYIEEISIST